MACITQRKRLIQKYNFKNGNETKDKALIDIKPEELRNTAISAISSNILLGIKHICFRRNYVHSTSLLNLYITAHISSVKIRHSTTHLPL